MLLWCVQPHDEWHGRVKEVCERGRQDRHIDVMPQEREQQRTDAFSHQHQTVVIYGDKDG